MTTVIVRDVSRGENNVFVPATDTPRVTAGTEVTCEPAGTGEPVAVEGKR